MCDHNYEENFKPLSQSGFPETDTAKEKQTARIKQAAKNHKDMGCNARGGNNGENKSKISLSTARKDI